MDLYQGIDPRDVGNYSLAEAADWLGLPRATLRTWLMGRKYELRRGETKHANRDVHPAGVDPLELSFWNLVECSVIAAIRKTHRVSFPKLRRALKFVESELELPRPLITVQFSTDGIDLFIEQVEQIEPAFERGRPHRRDVEVSQVLVSASERGQGVLRGMLEASLKRIERDPEGLAKRLYPWKHRPTEPNAVSVDPRVSFGRPTLASTGITVETIMDRFQAGDTIGMIATDYGVPADRVENVIRWAAGGAAAA